MRKRKKSAEEGSVDSIESVQHAFLTPELRFIILEEMRNIALPGKKYIPTKDIQKLFGRLGYEMSSFEKAKLLQSILFTPTEREISFDDLFLLFEKKIKEVSSSEEISECFKIISDEQGFDQEGFSGLMIELCGNHLSDEIMEMIRNTAVDAHGKVNSDHFVKKYTDLTPKRM